MSAAVIDAAKRRNPSTSRLIALGLAVAVATWAALRGDEPEPVAPLDVEVSPIPVAPQSCRVRGAEALAHAASVLQLAQLRWERVPFDASEVPRAIVQMAEAEVCFEAANDRVGRTRAAANRRAYEGELLRRFGHARLLLRVALRELDEPASDARIEARSELSRQQLAVLSALLERAPSSARTYRDELTQLARRLAAEAHARRVGKELDP